MRGDSQDFTRGESLEAEQAQGDQPILQELVGIAAAAGAEVIRPVMDQPYGDRSGMIKDPYGHVWSIGTHVEDVSPEEIERRMSGKDCGE